MDLNSNSQKRKGHWKDENGTDSQSGSTVGLDGKLKAGRLGRERNSANAD